MRIGIEAQRLFRPHKHGMDRVVLELIKNLQVLDKDNEYYIFVKPDHDNEVITSTENFNIIEIEESPYPIWEQVKLPRLAKAYNCDLLHCTSNTAPLLSRVPIITTLHDIIFKESSIIKLLSSSASWYQKIGNLYRRFIVNNVVKKSDQLITVSNFEKHNISNVYKLDDAKIKTVHNGVSDNFTNTFSHNHKEKVKQKYGLPKDFFLHLGSTDPRKNTGRVLAAFYKYTNSFSEDIKLVLLGLDENKLNIILKSIGLKNELSNKIILAGYVDDKDLPVIFNLANLFLFPSLREGFGIPIIEAMACGVPVITSNTSSMPEVAGDAACLVNPKNIESIYDALVKVQSNNAFKSELIQKGSERYKLFSWQNTAKSVLEIYREFKKKNI